MVTIDPVTGISAPAIVTTTPATSTTPATRQLAQIVTFQTGAVATGATTIPADNTIPQITEGTQFMSLAITPVNSGSLLEIIVTTIKSCAAIERVTTALFRDATANALAASVVYHAAGGESTDTFTHYVTSSSTSATTFTIRIGGTASTITFNGNGGSQLYGGVMESRITIKEYLP